MKFALLNDEALHWGYLFEFLASFFRRALWKGIVLLKSTLKFEEPFSEFLQEMISCNARSVSFTVQIWRAWTVWYSKFEIRQRMFDCFSALALFGSFPGGSPGLSKQDLNYGCPKNCELKQFFLSLYFSYYNRLDAAFRWCSGFLEINQFEQNFIKTIPNHKQT